MTNMRNPWLVKTSRGTKLVDIDPSKHSVIMGTLHERATYKPIGKVTRQPTADEIEFHTRPLRRNARHSTAPTTATDNGGGVA